MTHYDLGRMGWQQFEHLVQALAIKELGNGVRGFGQGKDGRREATFRGRVTFPLGGSEQLWNGYGVIQAKYRERPTNTTDDWRWFLDQVRGELDKWVAVMPPNGTLDLKKRPKYFIFATNITLTGTEDIGGIDQFEALLESYQSRLNLEGWFAWDYTQIRMLLDGHPDVRQTFLEQIVVGDFLRHLETLLPGRSGVTGKNLAMRAAAELTARQWVRIGDSGFGDNAKLRLSDIGIDLPCNPTHNSVVADSETKTNVGAMTIELGDRVCRPSDGVGGPQGIVIVGGPGQGKSTVAQLIAHNYRVAFIEETDHQFLGLRSEEVISAIRGRLRDQGFPEPQRRRYPLFVELSSFAAYVASSSEPDSLLRYVSESILIAGHPLDPASLLEWLAAWPCCLILDGLDEVPNARLRDRLIASISAFVTEASSVDADVFVVATTRPQGYRDEFDEALHTKLVRLTEFTEAEALAYASSIITVRSQDDPLLAEQVTDRLFYAVGERLTQRLMTSPLQVTIMTALAERAVDLPTTRYELFDAYYSTIYDREVAKSPEFKRLSKLRRHIDFLHERAGLLLQCRGEDPARPDPLLPRAEVAKVLRRRLNRAGFDEADSRQMTEELLTLASDRIVLLVSPSGRNYGFEVRSIQEYMAARALTEGTDDAILERLRRILPSSHWRNVWLLAAGRLLEIRQHLSEAIVEMVGGYDEASSERQLTRSAAGLAADLFLDNLATDAPVLRSAILETAMNLFRDTSEKPDPAATSVVVSSLAEQGPYQTAAIACLGRIAALSRSNAAAKVLDEYRFSPDPIGEMARITFARGFRFSSPERRDDASRAFVLGSYLISTPDERGGDSAAIEEFRSYLLHGTSRDALLSTPASTDWRPTAQAVFKMLEDEELRAALVDTIERIREREPDVAHYATSMLRYRASRLPRGQSLT